ncbi:MAG: UbiX family flavin prenyltransferase [Bacteroidales bacterium]
MLISHKNILLAVTGASGAIYVKTFIEKVAIHSKEIDSYLNLWVIFTQTAKAVFEEETGYKYDNYVANIEQNCKNATTKSQILFVENSNYTFKYASGSNKLDCMVILPCTMGSLARISQGLSIDLIGRIADVQLKEKRPIIVVPREAPYNLIHLHNMTALTMAGATIFPASPSFYNKPNTLNSLVDSFVERVMDIAEIVQLSERNKW